MILTLVLPILAIHIVAMMSPGPTFVVSVRIAAEEGLRAALDFAFGVGIGSIIWAVAAIFGLALLFEVAPVLLSAMKVLGGLFLIWIAIQTWRHATDPLDTAATGQKPRGILSAIRLGLITQLANPKTAVYFGAVFAGLLPPGTDWRVQGLVLVLIMISEVIWFSVIARVFSLAPARRAYGRAKIWVDRVLGSLIAVLGAKVATS